MQSNKEKLILKPVLTILISLMPYNGLETFFVNIWFFNNNILLQ